MSLPTPPADTGISTRPYLIRALHEWCTENGFTPYIAVFVDAGVQVPAEYVKNNEIVLNIGLEATNALRMGNDFIEFKARFGGTAREIVVPVTHVIAIYARENGQGMAFPAPSAGGGSAVQADADTDAKRGMPRLSLADEAAGPARTPRSNARPARSPEPPPPSGPGRPSLKRVK